MYEDNFFETFQVGQIYQSSGRQVTEADVRMLFGMAGGTHPLHIDPIYCASQPDVVNPIIPGSLALGIVEGFFCKDICSDNYVYSQPSRYNKIRFLKKVPIGEVLRATFEVKELADVDEFSGEVLFGISVYNSKEEIVTYIEEAFLIEKGQKGGEEK